MTIKSFVSSGVGAQNLISLGLAGAIKPFTEGMIAQTPIGNSTVISGAVKMIGGVMAHKFLGSGLLQNALVAALIVDGGEDLVRGVMGGSIFGGAGQGW
jgi:hypothetical protein